MAGVGEYVQASDCWRDSEASLSWDSLNTETLNNILNLGVMESGDRKEGYSQIVFLTAVSDGDVMQSPFRLSSPNSMFTTSSSQLPTSLTATKASMCTLQNAAPNCLQVGWSRLPPLLLISANKFWTQSWLRRYVKNTAGLTCSNKPLIALMF